MLHVDEYLSYLYTWNTKTFGGCLFREYFYQLLILARGIRKMKELFHLCAESAPLIKKNHFLFDL